MEIENYLKELLQTREEIVYVIDIEYTLSGPFGIIAVTENRGMKSIRMRPEFLLQLESILNEGKIPKIKLYYPTMGSPSPTGMEILESIDIDQFPFQDWVVEGVKEVLTIRPPKITIKGVTIPIFRMTLGMKRIEEAPLGTRFKLIPILLKDLYGRYRIEGLFALPIGQEVYEPPKIVEEEKENLIGEFKQSQQESAEISEERIFKIIEEENGIINKVRERIRNELGDAGLLKLEELAGQGKIIVNESMGVYLVV